MATLIDSYIESNYAGSSRSLRSGSTIYVGQSFANASLITLDSAIFYLYKSGAVGLPTGNMTAVLYAHTGTYGTSSKPTGSALATSDPIDASVLVFGSGGIQLITFNFSGANRIALSSSTNYCIELSYAGGDSSNFIAIGLDITSPTAGGNEHFSANGSSWTAESGTDVIFYVYGILVLPTVTTQAVSSIASTTATGNGNVTADGGATITERGVCW